jgi:hypothetical protein
MKNSTMSWWTLVLGGIILLLTLITLAPVVEKPIDKTGWFNEVCIDGVMYLSKASRLSVKLGTDSKVILCDSE